MNVSFRVHFKAALELLELISITSLIAVVADVGWVFRDMYVNEATWGLTIVAVLLVLAMLGMTYGIVKYHQKTVCKMRKQLIKHKAKECKHRYHSNRLSK